MTLFIVSASLAPAQTSQPSIQDQILNNLRSAPVGRHMLGDLNLPGDYLRRVGDRILRNSYEQQFRVVVPDGSKPTTVPASTDPPPIAGLEDIAVPTNSIWPTLLTVAIAGCSLAILILILQGLRAKR